MFLKIFRNNRKKPTHSGNPYRNKKQELTFESAPVFYTLYIK